MPSRSLVAPALTASLVALAGQSFAGSATPVFNWLQPVSDAWGTAGAWDQSAVPGRGDFVGADVFLNAAGDPFTVSLGTIGDTAPVEVGALVLGAQASLSIGLSASDQSSARSISLTDQSRLLTARTFHVHEDVDVGASAVFVAAAGEFVVGGILRNEGLLEWARGSMEATSVVNDGLIVTTFTNPAGPRDFIVSDEFINNGEIVMQNGGFSVLGDMVQRGSVDIPASSGFRLNGNLLIEDGATFSGAGSLILQGGQGVQRTVSGDLRFASGVTLQFGGDWTFGDAVEVGSLNTYETSLDSIRFDGHLQAGSISLAAGSAATFQSVAATGSAQISASTIGFKGDANFGGATSLSAQQIAFGGSYSFADDLAINAATVHFQNGLDVGGDLSVTANARITLGEGEGILVRGDNITWTTPSLDLEYALTVSGQIVVGVSGINAPLTAATLRIGAGVTALNADLSVIDNVSIAGTSLSIGAVGEIAHRTIHGDLTTTYAQSQAWDFDILGSRDRGAEESDTLAITGDASLYGVLRVNAIGGAATLRAGDEFTLLTAALLDGSFRALSLPSLSGGLSFDLVYELSAVRLVVVPAPHTLAAFALSALVAVRRVRR